MEHILDTIAQHLQDELSKIYFEARCNYLRDKSLTGFYQIIRKAGATYRFRDIDRFQITKPVREWIVWGCDDAAVYSYLLLKDASLPVCGYCLEQEQRVPVYTVPYISVDECLRRLHQEQYALLVACPDAGQALRAKFEALHFPSDRILFVQDHLVGRCGWQYFDLFSPRGKETFLDGGSLDGTTTVEFMQWCSDNCGDIYAFEPNPYMVAGCRRNLEDYKDKRIHFFENALWDSNIDLTFRASKSSRWDGCVSEDGQFSVRGVSLDAVLPGVPITFFKLDVEGCELEALKGATECIRRYHPRLAISIYHHAEDIVRLPAYLIDLVPDYKFYIRHYHSDCIETILYAC